MPPIFLASIFIINNKVAINKNGSPYPEVTRVILPSSLMIDYSNAFVFSTSLLVLVFRYGMFLVYLLIIIVKINITPGLLVFPELI
jgi:hypothetical protein